MQRPERIAAALAFLALGLGVWSVGHSGHGRSSLEPPPAPPIRARGVTGRRLVWREVAVPPRPPIGDDGRGADLFARDCAECHGVEGKGDGPAARAFSPPPRNFTTAEFRLRTSPSGSLPQPSDLYRTISTGLLATGMPGFAHLAPEDRWALVAQVISLTCVVNPEFDPGAPVDDDNWRTKNRYQQRPPEASLVFPPAPAADPLAPARGHEVFLQAGCAKCHGADGRGDGVEGVKDATGALVRPADYARLLTDSKAGADREDIFRVVTTGLAIMPSFAGLAEKDRWDLAAWVRSRAVPDDPVAETDRVRAGRVLFDRSCAACHGFDGRGDGPARPFLAVEPRDLTSGVSKWKSTPAGELPSDEDLHRVLRRGVPGTAMPPSSLLSEPELDALVAYLEAIAPRLRSTGRAPRPPVAVPAAPPDLDSAERIARGKELFGSAGCTSCHGATGQGEGPLAPILQDLWGFPARPRDLVSDQLRAGDGPEDTFRVLTVGVEGTPMPSFGALPESDRYALVAFVRELRRRGAAR